MTLKTKIKKKLPMLISNRI